MIVNDWPEDATEQLSVERIKVLIDDGIVDLATIDRLYGYRVFNIVANEVIRKAKLEGEPRRYWQDFIELHQALEKRRRKFSNKRPM